MNADPGHTVPANTLSFLKRHGETPTQISVFIHPAKEGM